MEGDEWREVRAVSYSEKEITFLNLESMVTALKEWSRGREVIVLYDKNGKLLAKVVPPTINSLISDGKIEINAIVNDGERKN